MSKKILFVDDDANILSSYQRQLRKEFSLDTALGGEPALGMIQENGPYAIIVSDMQMPGMNGLEFLARAEATAPDSVRVMLTGNADQKTAVDAVNQGHIFRFLTKPCEIEVLLQTLHAGVKQYQLVSGERELLEKTLQGSVKMLTEILSALDPQSFSRAQRLREYMGECARALNVAQPWEFEMAASLSQIGMVTVPPAVLEKIHSNQSLTGPENDLFGRVPETGFHLLSHIPRLETVANIIRFQNKNFDGTGFPADAIAGEEIPLGARLLRVLAELLLMESRKIPKFKALARLRECAGWFDPKVLESVALTLATEKAAHDMSHPVLFKDLRVGHVLVSDVVTTEGTKVVAAGTEITSVLLTKLRNFATLSDIREPIFAAG